MSDEMRLPCGCLMWTEETPSGKAFMYEPCSPDCQYFTYVQAEAERQKKPTTVIDLR